MLDKTMIIFLRNEKEKINKNLLYVCKNNKINFLFLNFGKELNCKNKKLINVKSKYMNKLLERIAFKKTHKQFLFVNISADEKYLLDTIERTSWYYEKYKEKAGIIDFTTSCSAFKQIITEEPRFYHKINCNLYKTHATNTYYFAISRVILFEAFSKKVETCFFKKKFEYLFSFICFYKKLFICKDTTFKILLDNKNLSRQMKKTINVFELEEKYFGKYINFYFILFLEILIFIVWKIPCVSFNESSKNLSILRPILKIKKLN